MGRIDWSMPRAIAALSALSLFGLLSMLDAYTLLCGRAAHGLWLLPAGLEGWIAARPSLLGVALLTLPAAFLMSQAAALATIMAAGEPLAAADSSGIAVRTRQGGVAMRWDEVRAIRTGAVTVTLLRDPQAPRKYQAGAASSSRKVHVPVLLVPGGAHAFAEMVMSVRPDLGERFGL